MSTSHCFNGVFEDADLEWLTKLYLGLTDSLRIDS